jgi:hypothetical protein
LAGSKTRSELNVVTIAILDDYQNVALTMVDLVARRKQSGNNGIH